MSLVPTDWSSFLWGIAIGALGTFFTGFFKKLGEDSWIALKRRLFPEAPEEQLNRKDIELYEKLLQLFPSGVVRFYEEHDFLGSFEKRYVDPLYRFADNWD